MIWLKRFAPLVVLGIMALGWYLWDGYRLDKAVEEQDRTALLTARTWVKLARYGADHEAFLVWRDSMLTAEGVTREEMYDYLRKYEGHEEEHLLFAQKVERLVDSLAKVEDSVVKAEGDSAK